MVDIYEIYNYIYEDTCSDAWFSKTSKHEHIGFIADTEENVKALVDEINANRQGTLFPKDEPEDEWDRDWEDANYIAYRKVNVASTMAIRSHWRCR